jgi:Uncharacterised nucleotidyltransferase
VGGRARIAKGVGDAFVNSIASVLKSSPAPSREAELLICCATSVATSERSARARAIVDKGVDWEHVSHMASVQAVMPLVYRYLTSELGGTLPAEATSGLRRAFYGNSVRNLHVARELVRLATLLEQGGVEPLALKGPALAMAAYSAVTMRQFNDLDLLVRKGEVRRAADILLAAGYAPLAGYSVADLDRPGAYEIAMTRAGALMEIDLHWRLIPPYFPLALDSEDLWRRAVRIEVEGAPVRTVAPADHLLYLCAHGAKHGWQALGGICDLAELIRATSRASAPASSQSSSQVPGIDWDELSARAAQAAAHRALELGVLLAHELLDAAVPSAIVAAARRERAVVRAARSFIAYASDPIDDGPGFYQRWVVPLGVIAGPGARLRYLAARALLPSADDHEFLRLPLALYPLYYLLRPVRVALKEGPAVVRRLMRSAPHPADHSSR